MVQIIRGGEKKKFFAKMKEQFGIEKKSWILVKGGKGRIRAFSGSMTREEIDEMCGLIGVETLGLYVGKMDNDLRLSLDGTHVLKNEIVKGFIELNSEKAGVWLSGKDLDFSQGGTLPTPELTLDNSDKKLKRVRSPTHEDGKNKLPNGIWAIKYGDNFLGCGIVSDGKLLNHVPKERRVKEL